MIIAIAALCVPAAGQATTPLRINFVASPSGFVLASQGRAAPLVEDDRDYAVVRHAVGDLADDIREVSGAKPRVEAAGAAKSRAGAVLIGTLGHSAPIDALVQARRLDVKRLRGAWESFLIATVAQPGAPGGKTLVIVGSDRRGTAYGVYELSRSIGVSPWKWWSDVPAHKHRTLVIPSATLRFGPPSVQYRGIFINDEDWGLYPWASRTFDPQTGNIGPRTYERVFRLLLRLKANTLWPAMHSVSRPFNSFRDNARLADEYGIVMGSSHAEPMLRNNVGEWKDAPERYNYAANPAGVLRYWEERARTNGRYESLWTLGMRGIHDSPIVGVQTMPEKVDLLGRVIADQRKLLTRYVSTDLTKVPQIFVPYKEVLDVYRAGLSVPDDVTIVWPDDNFGYVRHFPDERERRRSGGSGIYYHFSYLGGPLSYLWLSSTPPALIAEETQRAYDAGVRKLWIANVGDIKPAEIDISYFLDEAWDVDAARGMSQREFLDQWSTETFGAATGSAIGAVLDSYYTLNFQRRPEHLQWWLAGEKPRNSPLSLDETRARLDRARAMIDALPSIEARLLSSQRDAFFELVGYPVRAAAEANIRYFNAELYSKLIASDPALARSAGAAARTADDDIKHLTRRFNNEIARGKWRYIIAEEPADSVLREIRIAPLALPAEGLVTLGAPTRRELRPPASETMVVCSPAATLEQSNGWRRLDGLLADGPTLVSLAPGASARYRAIVGSGTCDVMVSLLPTYPTDNLGRLEVEVSVDGQQRELNISRQTEKAGWAQAVLNNAIEVSVGTQLQPGSHQIEVRAHNAGVGIRGITFAQHQLVESEAHR